MISEEQTTKAVGQFNLQLNGIFSPFVLYGLDIFIPDAKKAVLKLALQLHERLNGNEIPILR